MEAEKDSNVHRDVCPVAPIVIAGGGIAGLALALALQRAGLEDVRIFEKDSSMESRSQGYSLTIQKYGRHALKHLGVWERVQRVSSAGGAGQNILSADGCHLWPENAPSQPKGKNIFVARQVLRQLLLDAVLPGTVTWGVGVSSYAQDDWGVCVSLDSGDKIRCFVLVGSEGVRSVVRSQKLADSLNFLGVGMINGITCGPAHPLCARGSMQVLDGHSRLFLKPFDNDRAMWQLTFPCDENNALAYRNSKLEDLHKCALQMTASWHKDFRSLLEDTLPSSMRGGALFDRDPGLCAIHPEGSAVALIGDAAHPMSPFKGQGANNALMDAVELADILLDDVFPRVAMRSDQDPSQANLKRCVDFEAIPASLKRFHEAMSRRVVPAVLGSRRNVELSHTKAALDNKRLRLLKGKRPGCDCKASEAGNPASSQDTFQDGYINCLHL